VGRRALYDGRWFCFDEAYAKALWAPRAIVDLRGKQVSSVYAKVDVGQGPAPSVKHAARPLVEVEDLSFTVPIFKPGDRAIMRNPLRLLTDIYASRTRRSIKTILDGISFTLRPGERLGLIGPNGAGKSTLLRLLAGIYAPTSGRLTLNGTAKGLFDVSLGMSEEATGLENIYMRGLQMGMNLATITELVPEIIAFAELEDAIEQPLNTYSSGMRLRLAVTVSTMIEPDILLLDEWIGAGDARFSQKIRARMESLVEKSRGLILATHNEALMTALCTHGLLLSKGKLLFFGGMAEALERYSKAQSETKPPVTTEKPKKNKGARDTR
jgi:ABC-type polysaccharide/polyol phosphate transport system ATPase subunit